MRFDPVLWALCRNGGGSNREDIPVADFSAAVRMVAENDPLTFPAHNGSMILCSTTANDATFTDRLDATRYLIPIPKNADKIEVKTTDEKVTLMQFIGVKGSGGTYTQVFASPRGATRSYKFEKGTADYIAINVIYEDTAAISVPWEYDAVKTTTITFSAAVESGSSGGGGDNFPIGDGNTHILVSLTDGRTSPCFGVAGSGTATVDWGDGTEPDVLTPTSSTNFKYTPNHNYASAGVYDITLTFDGTLSLYNNESITKLLRHSSAIDDRNYVYANSIYKVEFGKGVTGINGGALKSCYSLREVFYSEDVTSISGLAFSSCYGVAIHDFTKLKSVPTLPETNAFQRNPSDCIFKIPASLYDEWIAATNWSALAGTYTFVGV